METPEIPKPCNKILLAVGLSTLSIENNIARNIELLELVLTFAKETARKI